VANGSTPSSGLAAIQTKNRQKKSFTL